MNAKWIRSVVAAAGALALATSVVSSASAEVGGDAPLPIVARPAAPPLTRNEVDQLLTQAQSAIGQGNLDRAEALVSRAEGSHIKYPMFHMGATPTSVRQELAEAQRARGGAKSALQNATGRTADPFAQRPMPLPSAPALQATQAVATTSPEGGMAPPVVPALHLQPVGQRDGNVRPASDELSNDEIRRMMGDGPAVPAPQPMSAAGPTMEVANLPTELRRSTPAPAAGNEKAQAQSLLHDAREALANGDVDRAEQLGRQLNSLGVSESMFLPTEDRPSQLSMDIRRARTETQASPQPEAGNDRYAAPTRLLPDRDATRSMRANSAQHAAPLRVTAPRVAQLPNSLDMHGEENGPADELLPPPSAAQPLPNPSARVTPESRSLIQAKPPVSQPAPQATPDNEASQLLEAGEAAVRDQNRQAAASLFGRAYVLRDQLNPAQQKKLQDNLQTLSATATADAPTRPSTKASTLLDSAEDSEKLLARQMSAEVGKKQSEARRMRDKKPQEAVKILQDARQQITDSKLSEEYKTQLVRRLDITLDETEKYVRDHKSEIELDEKNQSVLDEVNRNKEVKLKVQDKIAELVDQFNKLRDEQRFAEMEVVARRLIELAPNEPVAQQVWQESKFIRRNVMNNELADLKEDNVWKTLNDVENSSFQNVHDGQELVYDTKYWDGLKNRKGADERNGRRTERELEIERRLKTPVLLRYKDTPLSDVMNGLSELSGVNIHLDPRGLGQEGVSSDTPVTINLSKEISLKSALNLILEPLHLSYVVKDEVLKITSEQLRDGEMVSKVYNVADLVIPIPNFVPSSDIGLQSLINDSTAAARSGQSGVGVPGPSVLVNDRGPHGHGSKDVLAQQFGGSSTSSSPAPSVPIGSGPGGLGGAANADFDSLIDLITSTVANESWAENGGGEAEIRPFPTNLSLVISQTQAVHEQIADLLQQLRRLQDLQITIEVRFIRLNDSFFERIGIDFQMNIEDRTVGTADLVPGQVFEPGRQSAIVGLQRPVPPTNPFPNFTSDLDIPFRQNSFSQSVPAFGNPGTNMATFGFAILSDIEAYFLIEAVQGDTRSNVLNAPKVTLFNGQQAFVADAVSRPFVIGVIPVVGEFAAAQQPVIVVLNEGTLMTIQAVVSNDRRYVRLTVVPFFTEVGDVQEFTFEGTSSSTSSTSTKDDDENGKNESSDNSNSNNHTGVTVQLPSFQFVAVLTTVSVPDGGTVLLGGIKRLKEGRNEVGVPLLSKIPYVNRLFRNIGIGRETDSLMMMVTPRIIIQEEEEGRLGVATTP